MAGHGGRGGGGLPGRDEQRGRLLSYSEDGTCRAQGNALIGRPFFASGALPNYSNSLQYQKAYFHHKDQFAEGTCCITNNENHCDTS